MSFLAEELWAEIGFRAVDFISDFAFRIYIDGWCRICSCRWTYWSLYFDSASFEGFLFFLASRRRRRRKKREALTLLPLAPSWTRERERERERETAKGVGHTERGGAFG